jgi:hypothetical protein
MLQALPSGWCAGKASICIQKNELYLRKRERERERERIHLNELNTTKTIN